MALALCGGEERGSEVEFFFFFDNFGHSGQNLCPFHGHMSEPQEYPTWIGLSVSHSPFLG